MTKAKFCFRNRKLQQVRYSLYISLPVDWLKNMELKKGDELKVEMAEDNTLVITPVLGNYHEPQKLGANTSTQRWDGQHGKNYV